MSVGLGPSRTQEEGRFLALQIAHYAGDCNRLVMLRTLNN